MIVEQRVDQLLGLLRRERLDLDRRCAEPAAAPPGPDVEQLGTGEADDHEGRVLDALGEVLEQLEQRFLGPVHVLEDEDERLRLGELGGPFACSPGDLLLAALGFDPLEHADREREQVRHGVVPAARAQLLHGLLDGVVVGDAGCDLHHLGDRPVGDAFAVGQRAPDEDGCALDSRDELPREAALADAGLAVDREEMGPLVTEHAREGVVQELELVVAADEAGGERVGEAVRLDERDEPPGEERLAEALQVERAAFVELHARERQPARERADQDLAGRSRLLQPSGHVDRLAGREGRVGFVRNHLARLDADPRLQPEAVHGVQDRRGRPERALGVVLVRLRDPERGHDGVAGELLDDAAVRGDTVRDVLEERVDAAPDDLGIARGDELRRADEVDEEDGGELAFHVSSVRIRARPPEAETGFLRRKRGRGTG